MAAKNVPTTTPGDKAPPRASLSPIASENHRSLRFKLGAGAIAVLLVNLAIGLFAREQQRQILEYSINIYDTAFTSTNYIHQAQISFQHFVDQRNLAKTRDEIVNAESGLAKVLDELDVAIERSNAPQARVEGEAVRSKIAGLPEIRLEGADLASELASLQSSLEQLSRRASAVVLQARDDIDEFSSTSDLLMLASILTSIVLAGLALELLRRVVAQSTVAQITHMATYDSLTGLPNRTLLHSRMTQALVGLRRQDGAFAVLALDLDRFKNVNDTLGHHVGDLLLIEVSRRIEKLLRNTDMVARFGGDEFVILQTPAREAREAGALAERIVATVGAPYEINGQRILVGASVGVALAPTDGEDVDELLRNSDVALYRAKSDGKGRFRYFTAEMNALMQAKRMLELDLRDALEKESLTVNFQPLIDISTGRMSSCEALVRWTHPTRGPVPPAEFIPLAEETGLIVRLGEFVLRTACREATTWPGNLGVAVNLSAVQFRNGDITSLVATVLADTGLDARRLELEITESILIEDKDGVMRKLMSLRALGVRIALDDFGTGYSSLAYLSSFPFDKVKIDQSFVRNVTNRPDAAAIIRAILGLAKTLNMSATAEGIEDHDELDWLREQGCTTAQGYLFSRPVSASDFMLLASSCNQPEAAAAVSPLEKAA